MRTSQTWRWTMPLRLTTPQLQRSSMSEVVLDVRCPLHVLSETAGRPVRYGYADVWPSRQWEADGPICATDRSGVRWPDTPYADHQQDAGR